MLIKALCDYYDVLASEGKVLPDGYSKQNVHYLICLTPDGKIDEIVNFQIVERTTAKNGKIKEKFIPKEVVMPLRTEKSGIDGNIIEHRPLYIFGLNFVGDKFSPYDNTQKAEKSHEIFVEENLKFIEGLDSPVINAYRAFIENWQPKNETENSYLLGLGKVYNNSYFAFCLSGRPDLLLHEDLLIKEKWERQYAESNTDSDKIKSQCTITGEIEPIARIHRNLKGIVGGHTKGCSLICFNNASECSYGNEQSYNSNISETAMKKYTGAFNYLLSNKRHKKLIDDITVVYWATGGEKNEVCSDLMSFLVFGDDDLMDENQTEEMLDGLMKSAREGNISSERISSIDNIDKNVDFYMVGIKPNSSRVALKFIYHRKFGQMLENIALHQSDMQIGEKVIPVPVWRLKKELISPKSSNEKVDASLLAEIFKTIIYGTNYPAYLLSTIIRRVKTDRKINGIRAGAIKACINRKSRLSGEKEELKLALDYENKNQAYLCGRLFATLEKLQQEASNNSLNRTIKDSYFSSAASKPALVFPKLLSLAQNHFKKVSDKYSIFYNKLIQEIINGIEGEFPDILMLSEQGKFMIGYYQQYQSFFIKKDIDKDNINQEDK